MYSEPVISSSRHHNDSPIRQVGFGILRAAVLFGTASVMLALFLMPAAEKKAREYAGRPAIINMDNISTGSVAPAQRGNGYIVRRSVLSPAPEFICLSNEGNDDC